MAGKVKRSTMSIARSRVRMARDIVLQRKEHFVDSLALLNRAIASTQFEGHYWIFGGLLLGWAREGAILKNDYRDADFAFMAHDRDLFIEALGPLFEAGFRPFHRWRNNEGRSTEWVLERDGARFEFFEFSPVDKLTEPKPQLHGLPMFRHYGYFPRDCSWNEALANPGNSIEQVEVHLPYQERTEFRFLDSTWLKVADHELELDSLYGQRWRADREVFYDTPWMTSRDSPAVYSRELWRINRFDWDGATVGD
ncbi:MAG: hypothetical protein HKL84_05275 [Acidimicrobiaceae bacterium]|nr:hypothetical protein [Acidimicrobiaceae bacterium]